jgi:hypothetical protein
MGTATVQVALGLDSLYCPKCGLVIFDERVSWDESLCPHVRFVADWVGDLWVVTPDSVPPAQRDYVSWLRRPRSHDDAEPLAELAHRLPASCLVLTVSEPGRAAGRSGATVTIGLDLDPLP